MATRLYLANTAADAEIAGYSMPPSGWGTQFASSTVNKATTVKSNTSSTPSNSSGAANPQNRIRRAHASEPLAAQTITGTFKGQIRANQSFGTDDFSVQVRVLVVSGDGSTVRGTLVDFNNAALDHELATSLTNRTLPRGGSVSVTSVSAQAGDRIMIETGIRRFSAAGSTVVFDYRDDNANDLPENETETGALNTWVEFSQALTFKGGRAAAG